MASVFIHPRIKAPFILCTLFWNSATLKEQKIRKRADCFRLFLILNQQKFKINEELAFIKLLRAEKKIEEFGSNSMLN